MWKELSYQIRGAAPLLMHNAQLADPLNKFAIDIKKISGKRKKTESDHEAMARLEFFGGLYIKNGEPAVPGEMVEATFLNAAKKSKMGQLAQAGFVCRGLAQLEYDGPRDPNVLWEQRETFAMGVAVTVKRAKIMRTRPMFSHWGVKLDVQYNDEMFNEREVTSIFDVAGGSVGFGDWRPKYGLFTATLLRIS